MTFLYSRRELKRVSKKWLAPPWKRAEEVVVEEYDLVEDHASWHDARDPESGRHVEIKSCVSAYDNGQPGEFVLWGKQHEQLRWDDRIALLVHRPTRRHHVLGVQMVRPHEFPVVEYRQLVDHPTMGRESVSRVPWHEVIDLPSLDLAFRHLFAGLYSEEVVGASELLESEARPDPDWLERDPT